MRRGGVTSVILHQARALMEAGDEVLIISGEAAPGLPLSQGAGEIPLAVVEGLGYDRFRDPARDSIQESPDSGQESSGGGPEPRATGQRLADALCAAMDAHWGGAAEIFHVHNPLIQKNAALIPALNILNQRGVPLLLQNHDLAEDFRPDVYVGREDYPVNCHYAVINSRDYAFLHRGGLKLEGLHLIPNEVAPLAAAEGRERTRYLYPVRAIRRKNIGEALLISLFIPRGRTVAITLPPTTEQDARIYRLWADLARELALPVEFEVGVRGDFADLLGSAQAVLTTSVKEGFGFSFLEPWTAGRAALGRRIEYVCKDFEDAGIVFDSLYGEVKIPMEYVSLPALKLKMEQAMIRIYQAFGLEPPEYMIRMMAETFLSEQTIDFGRLDEEFQIGVIKTLASNATVFRDIAALNPFLAGIGDWRSDEALIAANNERIRRAYGRERIAGLLRDTYRAVLEHPVVHSLSKIRLLGLYLDPLRLSLVGVGHV
jgi:glycosyltransferase involved in cell wall biosynthesis